MTDHNHSTDDAGLEDLFQLARANPPTLPDGMMARVLAEGEAVQPVARGSRWRALSQVWGGARGAMGLVTATLVGVWIGAAPPMGVPDIAGALMTSDRNVEDNDAPYLTGFGWDFEEG